MRFAHLGWQHFSALPMPHLVQEIKFRSCRLARLMDALDRDLLAGAGRSPDARPHVRAP